MVAKPCYTRRALGGFLTNEDAMGIVKKICDIVPAALGSRLFGMVSDVELAAPLQKRVNRAFVRLARVNADEAAMPIDDYKSLNALFTRELKPDMRPIACDGDDCAVSPVDGRLSEVGCVADGMLLDVKGRSFSAFELVGAEADSECEWLRNAYAMTIYLSPRDYHHIHAPVSGAVVAMNYAPGRLLPVNRLGYALVDDLLPANERLTSFIEARNGQRVAVVKVGATCVGRISVVYDDFKTNLTPRCEGFTRNVDPAFEVEAGAPLGCFELGSTVVLLFENDKKRFVPNPDLQVGQKIKLGSLLGRWEDKD